jgi:hypothetical protein
MNQLGCQLYFLRLLLQRRPIVLSSSPGIEVSTLNWIPNFQSESENNEDSEKLYAHITTRNRKCDKNNNLECGMLYDTYNTSNKDEWSMASANDSEIEEYKWTYGSHWKKCRGDEEEEKLFCELHISDDQCRMFCPSDKSIGCLKPMQHLQVGLMEQFPSMELLMRKRIKK